MIAVFLLALAADTPAASKGFTPADLAAAAEAARTQPGAVARAVAAETERLRIALAYDTAGGIAQRDPDEQTALIGALGTGAGIGDVRARWFMAGAIAQPATGERTVLYNPLARGWLILGWRRTAEGAWRVATARVAAAGTAPWPAETGPWLGALVSDYAATHEGIGAVEGGAAGVEAERWIKGVADLMADPEARKATDAARQAVADGHAARFGGQAIDLMPARARATFWPVAAMTRKDGGRAVIFGSALMPQILIAGDFAGGASPTLARLTLINLDNAGVKP
ncbi:MAG: hypothetical protein V4475_08345 [Pseudomonadota bacterium]